MSTAIPFRFEEMDGLSSSSHERLLGLRAQVSDEGDSASFAVRFSNQRSFRVLIPFVEMPALLNEVRFASGQMVSRLLAGPDAGREQIIEMCACAMRPSHIDGLVERLTADRVYVMHFEDHAPVAVRIPLAMAVTLREKMENLSRWSHH